MAVRETAYQSHLNKGWYCVCPLHLFVIWIRSTLRHAASVPAVVPRPPRGAVGGRAGRRGPPGLHLPRWERSIWSVWYVLNDASERMHQIPELDITYHQFDKTLQWQAYCCFELYPPGAVRESVRTNLIGGTTGGHKLLHNSLYDVLYYEFINNQHINPVPICKVSLLHTPFA